MTKQEQREQTKERINEDAKDAGFESALDQASYCYKENFPGCQAAFDNEADLSKHIKDTALMILNKAINNNDSISRVVAMQSW